MCSVKFSVNNKRDEGFPLILLGIYNEKISKSEILLIKRQESRFTWSITIKGANFIFWDDRSSRSVPELESIRLTLHPVIFPHHENLIFSAFPRVKSERNSSKRTEDKKLEISKNRLLKNMPPNRWHLIWQPISSHFLLPLISLFIFKNLKR